MSPSPEKIGGQPASARGLRLEARITAPTWEIGLSAVVQDFTPGEVILLLDDQIAAGTRVTVQINNSSFVGDILFCSPSGGGYEAHVSFDDVDATGLRRTPRFPVSIPARIFSSASDAPLEGTIVDVSGEGLGIELTSPLPMQANIAVQSEENTALGVVRHCRELSSGLFRAGVQLHHIIRKDLDLQKASAESGWMNKLGVRLGRKKAERPKGWS
jgi:PilZ domain-containing protein